MPHPALQQRGSYLLICFPFIASGRQEFLISCEIKSLRPHRAVNAEVFFFVILFHVGQSERGIVDEFLALGQQGRVSAPCAHYLPFPFNTA